MKDKDTEILSVSWIGDILKEKSRAEKKFPEWPTDPLHAVAIMQEEMGELQRAVLQCVYEPDKAIIEDAMIEAIQLGAMVLRFLNSIYQYEFKPSNQHTQS